MAVAQLKKVGILGYLGRIDEVTTELQNLGMVHLTREAVPDEIFGEMSEDVKSSLAPVGIDIEQSSSEIAKTLNKTKQVIALLEKHIHSKVELPEHDEDFAKEYPLDKITKEALDLSSAIDKNNRQLRISERKLTETKHFAPLNIKADELKELESVTAFIGQMPLKQYEDITANPDLDSPLYAFDKINEHHSNVYFIGYCHNEINGEFEDVLRQHEFMPMDVDVRDDIPSNIIKTQEEEINRLESEIEQCEADLATLAEKELPSLLFIAEYQKGQVQCELAIDAAQKSRSIFYMTGWVRHELFPDLQGSLTSKYTETEVIELQPAKDEDPPVALSNPGWLQPFEILTNMYGRPRKGMIDPTPWTGPFFAVFFAFCMTDAGYGFLLALLGGGALLFKGDKLARGTKNFLKLILYLGVLTIGAGIVAGSYFGFNPSMVENPGGITQLMLRLKLFDPLEDAMLFFALTVFFGMFQLAIGFAISAFVKFIAAVNGFIKVKELLLGLGWVLLSLGLGLFITQNIYPQWAEPFDFLIMPFLAIGAIGVVVGFAVFGPLGGEKVVGSIFGAIGFDGLYGITGVFGDILSYARILALGISTGVIAGVINDLGGILAGGSVILGIVAAVMIAAGHIGYTALSALSAFIHPLRLQYVEYFGKFYETGGTDFEPFKKPYKDE